MIDDERVRAHRARALNPEHPFIRGTAQNPDTFFQAREAVSPFYAGLPAIVQSTMDEFAALTGRRYHLFEYEGPQDAERVVILMGSGADTARETAAALQQAGEKVGYFSCVSSGPSQRRISSPPCRQPAARLPSWNKPRSLELPVNRSILMSSNRLPRPCRVTSG